MLRRIPLRHQAPGPIVSQKPPLDHLLDGTRKVSSARHPSRPARLAASSHDDEMGTVDLGPAAPILIPSDDDLATRDLLQVVALVTADLAESLEVHPTMCLGM